MDNEKVKFKYFYYVKFGYNNQNYSLQITSYKDLEKEKSARCLIDTVEFGARDWLKAENLLVDGKVLQNVCLYDQDGRFIVCTSDLPYE